MFKKFFERMEAVRERLDQERDAAALRHGQSPEEARAYRSALYGRDALMNQGGDQVEESPEDTDTDTDTSQPD